MKNIAILGSTGSIGTQALEIIRQNPGIFKAVALSCGKNTELLKEQIEEFKPDMVYCEADSSLNKNADSIIDIATTDDADMVLNSMMGMRGMEPTLAAIEAGKDIAFANK